MADAESVYVKAQQIDPDSAALHVHYGLFLLDIERFKASHTNHMLS